MKSLILLLHVVTIGATVLNYPNHHLRFVLSHHPELCRVGAECLVQNGSCWGYERHCSPRLMYSKPTLNCTSDRQKDFNRRVDFGYIQEMQQEMMTICRPRTFRDSSLNCTRYTRYCVGHNIFINFHALLQSDDREKFREDLFNVGDIGGSCEFNKDLLQQQNEHKSALQSWYAELENFSDLKFNPLLETHRCDVIFNHTVVFMKLDYGGNMFHHFCDFFNLYVSQHLNSSWFERDFHVIMWDAATSYYFDPFATSWKVFTKHPVTTLMELQGKRVCIRDVMFPLLPRMRGGMYYNTYVPRNCVGSNLFRAFSEHFLYRMNIIQRGPLLRNKKPIVRLTLLQRGNPENDRVFRQIKNQDDLVKSLEHFKNIEVKVVEYNWKEITFEEQLKITHNTDIFIGMHGAGLAHYMFLPDWAVAFELYNCGDEHCYHDLARLRGLHYITWPRDAPTPIPYDKGKHKVYGENPKFWNWEFDVKTFRKLVADARKSVLNNLAYQSAVKDKLKEIDKDEL